MLAAPVDRRMPQVEVAERTSGGDVGQRMRFAVAPRLVAELARHVATIPRSIFSRCLAIVHRCSAAWRASPLRARSPRRRRRCRRPALPSASPRCAGGWARESVATPGSRCRGIRRSRANRRAACRRPASAPAPCRADCASARSSCLAPTARPRPARTRSSSRRARCAPCGRKDSLARRAASSLISGGGTALSAH